MAETNGIFRQEMRRVPPGEFARPNRKTNGSGVQAEDTRICVVMVGLPARGKSLIATKGESPRSGDGETGVGGARLRLS